MTWHPERIGEAVRRELARFGGAHDLAAIVAAWPGAVGAAIAANAWPARVARDGTLHVAASSSAWAFELTQLEDVVRARLRERLGEAAPARLRFAPGKLPERGPEPASSPARTVPKVTEVEAAEGERIAAGIADSALRAAVARAAAASLARAAGEGDDRFL